MDPATFIAALAAHLLSSGGLLFLIARRLPPRGGVRDWAAGLMLFGAAYAGRLALGLGNAAAGPALLLDLAMVAATLLFVTGLRRFTGRAPLGRARAAALLLAFVALDLAALAWQGATGRAVVLNAALGLVYAALAHAALRAPHRVEAVLQRPLQLMAAMMALLAAMTLARGAIFALQGTANTYSGLFSQVYYAYASLAAVLLAMLLLWLVFERLAGQLTELATHDPLTRLLNRAGLDEALARHFGSRQPRPVTLLAVDVDHFKRINDSHGHAAGDRMLCAVAETLAEHVRPDDLVARVGGEEFVVCCPGCDAACAQPLAERLRQAVAAQARAAADDGTLLQGTVSIGISRPCLGLDGWACAAAEADAALYAAKAAGRDRVVCTTAA